MKQPVSISFDGLYRLELLKDDSGEFISVIITKKDQNGFEPILDFPVKQIQQNENIGLELEFNSENIFVN